jgi:hypothetical protein
MALTIDQRKRLLEALNDVFTSKDVVEDLAQGATNRTLAQISLADNLPAILRRQVDGQEMNDGWAFSMKRLRCVRSCRPGATSAMS